MSAMGINPVDLPFNPVYHNITGHEPKLPTRDEPSLLSKVFHDPRNNYVSPDDEHLLKLLGLFWHLQSFPIEHSPK
jgi:hypothetical protein